MLDKLIELILQFIDDILPFKIVPYYDRGVRLRFGNPKMIKNEKDEDEALVLQPGFHWKIPFADNILTTMIKSTTISLSEQTVTTKNNVSIVVKSVIKYKIQNAGTLLLEVNDPIDAISDMTQGIIRDTFIGMDYEQVNDSKIANDITVKARREAKKWGIEIETVTLTDLGKMTSIRLLNSKSENVSIVQ